MAGTIADLIRQPGDDRQPQGHRGRVDAVSADGVEVILDGFDSRLPFGPLPWAPTGSLRSPVKGDRCVLFFDDDGQSWAIVEGSGAATGDVTPHAASHAPGGSDPLPADAAAGTASLRSLGTGALQAAAGNDPRLSDARAPTAHAASHAAGGTDALPHLPTAAQKAALPGTSGTPGDTNRYVTNQDSRLSNARTPTAHAATHVSGGSDRILDGGSYRNNAAWATNPPPNGTSGTPIDVVGGTYVFICHGTAYKGATGLGWNSVWIDGVGRGSAHFYFNETFVHLLLTPNVFTVSLGPGRHYVWQAAEGCSTDSNDSFGFVYVRIG